MTKEEKRKLEKLGWDTRELHKDTHRWLCKYYMAVKLEIRVESNHKARIWEVTERVIDSLTDEEVEEVISRKKKRTLLAATILLSQ